MTAEVAVMNRIGVALAADSAVTVGDSAQKIWTSAEKLFQLSECSPVGIMIYGNAHFQDLPWETVIKHYRATFGSVARSTVRDYADHFLSFLLSNPKITGAEATRDAQLSLCFAYLSDVRHRVAQKIDRKAEEKNGLDSSDIPPLIEEVVASSLHDCTSRKAIAAISAKSAARAFARVSKEVEGYIDELFGPDLITPKIRKTLASCCKEMLRREMFGPLKTGVVFAGFGSDELLPSLVDYEIEGIFDGALRARMLRDKKVSATNSAAVIPFAQHEMVYSFMQGVDRDLFEYFKGSSSSALSAVHQTLLDHLRPKLKKGSLKKAEIDSFNQAVQKLADELVVAWDRQQEKYWRPVLANAASLPKDELASMAEAFVNLTKFRRRASTDRETVGGPIDVAVITRGDGFVWVKRKHYFSPELNPRVMGRIKSNHQNFLEAV